VTLERLADTPAGAALTPVPPAKRECSMPGPTPRRTVLVVEDDAAIRELPRLHLDLSGFAIDEADEERKVRRA